MSPFLARTPNASRCGFTLTELAVVVTIIGVLTSLVWVYLSQSEENARRQQLAEELTTIVGNIRALYSGQAGIGGAAGDAISVMVPLLIKQNAIPSNLMRTGGGCTNSATPMCADTPWGPTGNATSGTFAVCAWTGGPSCPAAGAVATVQLFAIELSGISFANCVSIAPQISASGGPSGLQDVFINGVSAVAAGTLPVPVAFVSANCAAANTIDFVYRLHPGNF